MKPAPFQYHAPSTLADALAILGEVGPDDGRVLAGGQSLMPAMALRLARPTHLVDINAIAELAEITRENGALRIGALVRHVAFSKPVEPGPTGQLLAKVVHNIAHQPIRFRGTMCGSLANADPASEWCTTAVGLDAEIIANSSRGERGIPAKDFFKGFMTTALEPDEMITAVRLPLLAEGTRTAFTEFSRRAGDFGIAMVLATYRVEADRIAEARIAVGGVESSPRRLAAVEQALNGEPPDATTFKAAAEIAADAVQAISDAVNTADYRRHLVRSLTQRTLERAAA